MKIAITSQGKDLESQVDGRFGRCRYFVCVDLETMKVEAVQNAASMVSSGAGAPAAFLVERHGVEAVLTNHVGPTAGQLLSEKGIDVFIGIEGTAQRALDLFREKSLKRVEKATVESGFGRHD